MVSSGSLGQRYWDLYLTGSNKIVFRLNKNSLGNNISTNNYKISSSLSGSQDNKLWNILQICKRLSNL